MEIEVPAGATTAAVLLHPHPDMGGDMHNPVVNTLYRRLTAAGAGAIRFDFSSSQIDVAQREAVGAIDRLASEAPGATLVVVGYSFGAAIASTLDDERIAGWGLVAPPVPMMPAGSVRAGSDGRPCLVLVPEHDQFSPPPKAAELFPDAAVVPGADHFLMGATHAVADAVLAWLAEIG